MIRLEIPDGIALTIDARGAAWMSCDVPVSRNERRGVILQRAATDEESFLGSTIGRYANRIAHGRIHRQGHEWQLARKPGAPHHLHGGPGGFHARTWQVEHASATQARFTLHSAAGDQGYPGEVDVQVTYRLVDPMTIDMHAQAVCTEPTPLALTNHAYFNLDGTPCDVRNHSLAIHASHYVPVDRELIPLGPLARVEGTGFDFRRAKAIARDWLEDEQQRQAGGYDHAFLLDASAAPGLREAARLTSSDGGVAMSISTTLPAMQFYSGQYLAGTEAPGGSAYAACSAIALEPGFLPDSPNHPEWPQPSCWLLPGQAYEHTIRYSFATALP